MLDEPVLHHSNGPVEGAHRTAHTRIHPDQWLAGGGSRFRVRQFIRSNDDWMRTVKGAGCCPGSIHVMAAYVDQRAAHHAAFTPCPSSGRAATMATGRPGGE